MLSSTLIYNASKMTLSRKIRSHIFPFSTCHNYNTTYAPLQIYHRIEESSIKPIKINKLSCYLYKYCNHSTNNKDSSKTVEKIELNNAAQTAAVKVSQRAKLKQAVRDYGATIVVFHVAISLASLGICYTAISYGLDVTTILGYFGVSESVISSKVAAGASTFVIAYAVHKVFAPIRIGITLSVAPFIVRYLRKINWLKPPKIKE